MDGAFLYPMALIGARGEQRGQLKPLNESLIPIELLVTIGFIKE
mgnify:FL=1